MHRRLIKNVLVSLTSTLSVLLLFPAIAGASGPERPVLQASSTVPVDDNRIAALWSVIPDSDRAQGSSIRRDCTASYVGDNFWITAHHCVSSMPVMDGFLRQSDGETAGIAAVYVKSSIEDVALIKVGDGINADTFTLAKHPLEVGQQAFMTGYGLPHDYASTAVTMITEKVESLNFGNATYTKLFKGKSLTDSRSCSGDSGAPVYRENTLYAVHTAGGFNPSCTAGKDRPMWHTDIVPRLDWLEETIQANTGLSPQEKAKAKAGLKYAAAPSSVPNMSQGPNGSDSRISSQGSSLSSLHFS